MRPTGTPNFNHPILTKKLILIAEDVPTNRKLLRVVLETEGYEIVEAADGVEALRGLASRGVDLIISDILMPNMDGFRLCREVRHDSRWQEIPFLFYSSTYTSSADQAAARELGADAFLVKPSSAAELRATIQGLLNSGARKFLQSPPDALVRKLEKRNADLAQRTLELHTSELRLRTILDTVPDDVQVLARDGAVLESNSISRAHPQSFCALAAPEYRAALEAALAAGWQGQSAELEFEIIQPPSVRRWLEIRLAPLRDQTGEISSLLTITRDHTERKRLEQQNLQAQKMEVLGHLASGVAHDFNNFLSVVMGYSEMIMDELSSGSEMHGLVQEIFHASERAAGLTRQLLIFSRQQTVQPQVFDLSELIAGIDGMLRRLIPENVNLITLPEPELSHIQADPGQIEQVLMNLTVNARDAMPGGGTITIESGHTMVADSATGKIPPGSYVTFSVTDDGNGMTEEVKAKLFETFFTTKPAGKGTGLGLATSLGIVQYWGGHITVESTLSVGTIFTVYLPAIAEPASAAPRSDAGPLPRGTETILLVEDEPGLRELTATILGKQGYTVLKAVHGHAALRTARECGGQAIDLVLTDMVMPEMGGKMMAESLRVLHPEIKILFTSGYTDCDDASVEVTVDFLPKPFTPSELVRRVRQVIDRESVAPVVGIKGDL